MLSLNQGQTRNHSPWPWPRRARAALRLPLPAALACLLLSGCASLTQPRYGHRLYVSVPDQKMIVLKETPDPETREVRLHYVAEYPVSTSKFGLGSQPNSMRTPLGRHQIAKKIGHGAPLYAKFKDRRMTGEIVLPDSPGRDPIVTRILWLRGMEPQNANSFGRYIYIHGTPEERKIGKPASYGCIRMKSVHVAQLFALVDEKDEVFIINKKLNPAAYLPPPGTPPAVQPPVPESYLGPPRAVTGSRPQARRQPASGEGQSSGPQRQMAAVMASPPAMAADAQPADETVPKVNERRVARYQRKGVNARRIFE
jgi:hypothetical protein